MRTVTVPVIKAFTHEGQSVVVGDSISVAPIVAAALARRGVISLVKGYQTRVMAAEPFARSTRPAQRRTYRRRDQTARVE